MTAIKETCSGWHLHHSNTVKAAKDGINPMRDKVGSVMADSRLSIYRDSFTVEIAKGSDDLTMLRSGEYLELTDFSGFTLRQSEVLLSRVIFMKC